MYLNTVHLIGFVGKDPERRQRHNSLSGTEAAYVVFSVATQQSWKDSQGAWQKRTEWHRVTAWNAIGERAAETLRSGDHVLIRGCFVSATYDKQYGDDDNPVVVKQTFWQVRADSIHKLDRAASQAAPAPGATPAPASEDDSVPF